MKKILAAVAGLTMLVTLTGCDDDAYIASENLSKAADNFEIPRRIVFVNGITDEYLLEISGRCSIADQGNQLEVVCKEGENAFKKHFLGLSDNVFYVVEQLENADVSVNHYRVTFKPQSIVPDIDFRGSTSDIPEEQN